MIIRAILKFVNLAKFSHIIPDHRQSSCFNNCRLQPLLAEIKKDRHTVAMGTLDYVNAETFHYRFYEDYMTRYGFDWKLTFFETFWRNAQLAGRQPSEPRV